MKSAEQKISEQKIRTLVTSSYDIQALRISVGNRIVASFNAQLGIHQNDMNKDAKDKDEEDKEATKTLSVISKEYDKITEAYVANQQTIRAYFKKNDPSLTYIKSEQDYKLVERWKELLHTEQQINKLIKTEAHEHPMWDAFFSDVIGCGEQMAAIIISYFDVDKARHPSCFWKYAGLDVVDGKGRLKKPGCHYEQVYRDYRARIEQRKDLEGATARKHRMALRYCTKMFYGICGRYGVSLKVMR